MTQRGSRRLPVFLRDGDQEIYLALLAEACRRDRVELLAYCLMPNHVHLIAVPERREALARAIAAAHRRYADRINRREGWCGHLWQERFHSFAMDPVHLRAAFRYVLTNPVRAGLVESPASWPHSSAATLLAGSFDPLVDPASLRRWLADWEILLEADQPEPDWTTIRSHSSTGRPLGGSEFVRQLEKDHGLRLTAGRPGRPRSGTPSGRPSLEPGALSGA